MKRARAAGVVGLLARLALALTLGWTVLIAGLRLAYPLPDTPPRGLLVFSTLRTRTCGGEVCRDTVAAFPVHIVYDLATGRGRWAAPYAAPFQRRTTFTFFRHLWLTSALPRRAAVHDIARGLMQTIYSGATNDAQWSPAGDGWFSFISSPSQFSRVCLGRLDVRVHCLNVSRHPIDGLVWLDERTALPAR